MVDIGIIRGARVGVGYRGDDVVLMDVEMNDPSDVQTVEYLFSAGESFIPPVGAEVLVHTVSSEQKIGTACDMNVVMVSGLNAGDRRLFAVKDGQAKAMIDLLGTGEIVLNGGSGFAVAFAKLKYGFDKLVADFNEHIHTGTVTGSSCSVTKPQVSSSASIDECKVEKVRL